MKNRTTRMLVLGGIIIFLVASLISQVLTNNIIYGTKEINPSVIIGEKFYSNYAYYGGWIFVDGNESIKFYKVSNVDDVNGIKEVEYIENVEVKKNNQYKTKESNCFEKLSPINYANCVKSAQNGASSHKKAAQNKFEADLGGEE